VVTVLSVFAILFVAVLVSWIFLGLIKERKSALVQHRSEEASDSNMRQMLIGTWATDWDPSRTVENKPDGSCVVKFTINLTNAVTHEGTWQVKDGFVVGTTTNASWPNAMLEVESNKVVSIDDDKLVILSRDGGTNLLTLHKKR
jgi:hypothetical protein